MSLPDKIDFIIIGAQKAGTTSIFNHLRAHPNIYMPFLKEVCFFSRERSFRKGLSWYLNHFSDATSQQVVGEASPQYMMNLAVPKRIHDLFPETKLIAILRNPIDRGLSAYRMAVKQGIEKRTIEEALKASHKSDLSLPLTPLDFVGAGLYGKILEEYLKYFPIEQIQLVFTEEFAAEPKSVLQNLYNFLGVNADFTPDNIHHVYHRGGVQKHGGLQGVRRHLNMLEKLMPNRYRGWTFRFDQWNTKSDQITGLSIELRNQLADYYRADTALLEQLFQIQTPWQEFRGVREPEITNMWTSPALLEKL